MQRWFALALIALMVSSCASGRQPAVEAPAGAPSSKLRVDVQVASKPPGAQVEVLEPQTTEPNNPQESPSTLAKQPSSPAVYRKTGKQGVTPCQFTLEANQPMTYCLEFRKDGYQTVQEIVNLYETQGQTPQKIGNVIGKAGDLLIAPPLWIVGWAIKKIPGSKSLEANPNPVTVTLSTEVASPAVAPSAPMAPAQPASPAKSLPAQTVDLSCLFRSLTLSPSAPQEISNSGGPTVAMVVPLGTCLKIRNPSREFSCQILREELEKGGKLGFFKGSLETGNQTYHFQDGASIVAQGSGKFQGYGITCQTMARTEEPKKEETSLRGRKAPRFADEEDE